VGRHRQRGFLSPITRTELGDKTETKQKQNAMFIIRAFSVLSSLGAEQALYELPSEVYELSQDRFNEQMRSTAATPMRSSPAATPLRSPPQRQRGGVPNSIMRLLEGARAEPAPWGGSNHEQTTQAAMINCSWSLPPAMVARETLAYMALVKAIYAEYSCWKLCWHVQE
jgi:hypothetical protein